MKKEKITKRRRTMCSSYRVQSAVMQRAHRFIIARRRCIGRRGRREAKVRALGCVCYETIAQELVSRPNTIFLLSILVCFVCFFVPPQELCDRVPACTQNFPPFPAHVRISSFLFFGFGKEKKRSGWSCSCAIAPAAALWLLDRLMWMCHTGRAAALTQKPHRAAIRTARERERNSLLPGLRSPLTLLSNNRNGKKGITKKSSLYILAGLHGCQRKGQESLGNHFGGGDSSFDQIKRINSFSHLLFHLLLSLFVSTEGEKSRADCFNVWGIR